MLILCLFYFIFVDGLLLFDEAIQKSKSSDDQRRIRALNKAKDAKEAASLLATNCQTVRELLEKRQPPQPPPVAAQSTAARAKRLAEVLAPPVNKKPKTSGSSTFQRSEPARAAASAKETLAPVSAILLDEAPGASLIGRRVAKRFDEGIFFGTIKEFLPIGSVEEAPYDLWSVLYDDEDEEDLAITDIKPMLELYIMERKRDRPSK